MFGVVLSIFLRLEWAIRCNFAVKCVVWSAMPGLWEVVGCRHVAELLSLRRLSDRSSEVLETREHRLVDEEGDGEESCDKGDDILPTFHVDQPIDY